MALSLVQIIDFNRSEQRIFTNLKSALSFALKILPNFNFQYFLYVFKSLINLVEEISSIMVAKISLRLFFEVMGKT